MLRPIQRLFGIERAIKDRAKSKDLSWEELVALRAEIRGRRSVRVLEQIRERANQLSAIRSTLPTSALGKALKYLANQWERLTLSVTDARLPIHNNDAERDLRHIAVGRRNWLVFASERGGAVASRLYSIILSCKEVGANPEAYLEDALRRISTTRHEDIAQLTPWAWAEAKRRESSD